MSNEELVREIVEKVLIHLKLDGSLCPVAPPGKRKVMVVVTGATIGAQTALAGLIRLKEERGSALDYIVLFSRAAAEIHKPEEVGKKLEASEVLVEGKNSRGRAAAVLKQCDLVAVPALTRNTAARTALMLLDSAATEVLVDALMRGLPVIAAKDAADPMSEGFARLGLNLANPALIRTMAINLERIAGYGVILSSSAHFGRVLEKTLFSRVNQETPPLSPLPEVGETPRRREATAEPAVVKADPPSVSIGKQLYGQRRIITRADLGELVGSDGVVRVSKGAVITPLVRDIIRDAGWRLKEV